MKFGVREICDVVLKAKTTQRVGNKIFYKNEPVIYFDTLKTSSMEGAATTVYAQGGRGNSRLVAWEGERTITFTMEDALISPAGFMILSGAGLVEAGNGTTIKVHHTEQTNKVAVTKDTQGAITGIRVLVTEKPYDAAGDDYIYVMRLDDRGEVYTEPYLAKADVTVTTEDGKTKSTYNTYGADGKTWTSGEKFYAVVIPTDDNTGRKNAGDSTAANYTYTKGTNDPDWADGEIVLVDFYVEETSNAYQIEITPDKFGGNYYLEASTLFRTPEGVDLAAEFVIPNCKIQSNFTFTMASSGDPSSFTFTMDAFPDFTRFDKTKKVIAAIQVVDHLGAEDILHRKKTPAGTELYV